MAVRFKVGPWYWQARFKKWPAPAKASPGYSLLVPVPGDLPVFLRLALAVCKGQQSQSRLETIVVPDIVTEQVRSIVAEASPTWPGRLFLQPLPQPEKWMLPRLGDPGRNHALQLIAGVSACRSTHIVLHDADLFLLEPDLLDQRFELCQSKQLACLGISPVWDTWFEAHNVVLAATWELCARVDWVRSFPPVEHMAHKNTLFGEEHVFDTTLYPQALTDQALVGVVPSDGFVHFNYVISNYRKFVKRGPEPWFDSRFLVLFVSLLVELFDRERWGAYQLPRPEQLASYLGSDEAPLQYPGREGGGDYRRFRSLLGRALQGDWASDEDRARARQVLLPFDDFFSYEQPRG